MSFLDAFTRGGQTGLHKINMNTHVLLKTLKIAMLCFLICFAVFLFQKKLENYCFLVAHYKATWRMSMEFLPKGVFDTSWIYSANQWVEYSDRVLAHDPRSLRWVQQVWAHIIRSALWSGFVFILIFILISFIWIWRDKKNQKPKVLKGYECLSNKALKRLVYKKGASSFKIADLPLPRNAECEHFLITGTTGSGKTNAVNQLITQIKARGDKAVIVDSTAGFLSRFYDPTADRLLNPFDIRSQNWSLWKELVHDYDYDEFAESLVPTDQYDKFWTRAAQQLLSATLMKMTLEADRSIDALLNHLLKKPLSEIVRFYQETLVSAYVDPSAEKTALGIRATLVSSIQSLKYLKAEKNGSTFSIREWITSDKEKGCLFLSCLPTQREALKPLMSAWLSVALKSLMSAGEHSERRVWFIIDELASLNRIPILMPGLSEIRKYGGCIALSFQDFHQVEMIYGLQTARTIGALCGTKLIFRLDSHAAQQMAELFGQQEILESTQSISYGAHQMRDGVSLRAEQRIRWLLSPSDLMQLDNLEAYLKFPRNLPITKIQFKYFNKTLVEPDFIPQDRVQTVFKESTEPLSA